MHTARFGGHLSCHTCSLLCHACPSACMPPSVMHAPMHAPVMHAPCHACSLPYTLPCHACPPATHAPPCHAHPLAIHAPPTMHATAMHIPLSCIPLPCIPHYQACPLPCMSSHHVCPPAMHDPLPCTPNCGHTDTCENIRLRAVKTRDKTLRRAKSVDGI